MNKLIFALLGGILIFSSCKKTIIEPIYEVRLPFSNVSFGTTYADFTTLPSYTYYVDFDKRDYPHMDSITFNATLVTDLPTHISTIRLFNVTDNVEIENSTLSASTTIYETKTIHTNNLVNALPEKKITLAIQGKGVGSGAVLSAFLKLRRY